MSTLKQNRFKELFSFSVPSLSVKLCFALRQKWREGYAWPDVRSDIMAGIIVGMVAIPLAMALSIASGVPPQQGLYTVIIGGALVGFFGGSRCQVTGPTAAFVVILLPIVHQFGLAGLLIAGFLAGIILVFMGLARLGQFIQFIPYPVTTGFTSGIALVIASLQLKDFFGLHLNSTPENFFGRLSAYYHARGTWSPVELVVGGTTLALLIFWPRINKKIPVPLVALTVAALAVALLQRCFPHLNVATIGNRFDAVVNGLIVHGIPNTLPRFIAPWRLPNGDISLPMNFQTIHTLLPSAIAIALLGAIESLLSAMVADGMTQTRHDPDAELIALGVGNILCPFFGGIPATGAIARTATNIRFGARSPIAAIAHAFFVFLSLILFARAVSFLPMASLAALLILVAYNMSEIKHFKHIVDVAPRRDVVVLLVCFGLTVFFDMVIGVSVGVGLAAFLFLRKIAFLTEGKPLTAETHPHLVSKLPKQILLYEIAGPLFFAAAERAIESLSAITDDIRVVVFLMDRVPTMDISGLIAFESTVRKLIGHGRAVILSDVKRRPLALMKRSGLLDQPGVHQCDTEEMAIEKARDVLAKIGLKTVEKNRIASSSSSE